MLTQADTQILELEQAYPRRTGLKQDRIIHTLGMSEVQYQQRLQRLAHDPEAVAAYPQVCSRVKRLTARRTAQRQGLLRMLRE